MANASTSPVINAATKAALANVASTASAPRKETPVDAPQRAFYLAGPGFNTMFTSKGDPVTFFNGVCITDSAELIEELGKMKDVKEIEYNSNLPVPPSRKQVRRPSPVDDISALTTISPQELMNRTIANSNSVPQANNGGSDIQSL